MITPVCQSFVFLLVFTPLDTPSSTNGPSPFNAFTILDQILFSPAVFPDFNSHLAASTSVNVKTSSFPKSIVSHVSVGVAFTGFNKSSKYSLQRERIFSSGGCSRLNP